MSYAPLTANVVRHCAQECEWQRSDERSVGWMVEGWLYARRYRNQPVKLRDVLTLGRIVEPRHNMDGLRRVGVRVGFNVKMDPAEVPGALDRLIAHQPAIGAPGAAGEWFRQYEEVHPFRDGNGRTGNLLYNWLSGTLRDPVMPPNFWHDPRRTVG